MRLSFNKTILTPSDLKSIKSVIENFGLFEIKDGLFFSKSVLERLKARI